MLVCDYTLHVVTITEMSNDNILHLKEGTLFSQPFR